MALLEVSDLKKSFMNPEGRQVAVLDVPRFELAAGVQVGLAGSSGTGKTTFLHCLAGILTPDSGTIMLDGQPMTGISEPRRDSLRARSLGYIFQTFNLLQGFTCLENVLLGMSFGRGIDRPRAQELLRRVGLGDRMNHRPQQLSTGQQQRIAVARALANQPKLVLADEPTGNLDTANASAALTLIREVCREAGATLLCVSHDPAVLGVFSERLSLNEINRAASGQVASRP
jgi:putative ABC transport system ATP-binding protein